MAEDKYTFKCVKVIARCPAEKEGECKCLTGVIEQYVIAGWDVVSVMYGSPKEVSGDEFFMIVFKKKA